VREPTPAGDDAAADADAIERLVARMDRFIDDLLDVSRIMGDKFRLDPEDVDLGALVHEVVDRLPETQRALVSLDAPSEPVRGLWDRSRIDQIVSNLISNALKYGDGKPVHAAVERVGERARLVVRDDGIGIEKQNLKRIFERFERAAARDITGHGIGLWIVRQVVHALGGTVDVSSRLGEGSTFVVELPLRASRV
jgi:signal transduction histidine kinase